MRRLSLLALLLVACDDGGTPAAQEGADAARIADAGPADAALAPDAAAPPTCSAAAIRDPAGSVDGVFPDDVFTVPDEDTATGLRVHVAEAPGWTTWPWPGSRCSVPSTPWTGSARPRPSSCASPGPSRRPGRGQCAWWP
ncbi:MAG: hypothetical protein R3F60_02605 [bacterium]